MSFASQLNDLGAAYNEQRLREDQKFLEDRQKLVQTWKAAYGLRETAAVTTSFGKSKLELMTELAAEVVDPARALASLALAFNNQDVEQARKALNDAVALIQGT